MLVAAEEVAHRVAVLRSETAFPARLAGGELRRGLLRALGGRAFGGSARADAEQGRVGKLQRPRRQRLLGEALGALLRLAAEVQSRIASAATYAA